MGRIHLVGGEKGGVGKSVLARLLVQYMIDRAVRFAAFDADPVHGALLRYYAGYAEPVDVHRMEDLDRLVDALDDGCEEVVLDLAARTEAPLEAWLAAGEVPELLARLDHRIWWWYVLEDGKDSVRLLADRLDRLPERVHLVCVLNRGRGEDFGLFEESKLRARIEQRSGDVIELPAIHPLSMRKMDAYDKSFWAALHNVDPSEGPCLTRMERQRARVAIERAHAIFRGLLAPGTEARSGAD